MAKLPTNLSFYLLLKHHLLKYLGLNSEHYLPIWGTSYMRPPWWPGGLRFFIICTAIERPAAISISSAGNCCDSEEDDDAGCVSESDIEF